MVSEKSLGFGKFGIVKKSLGIGFGQNFGIVIQWSLVCGMAIKAPDGANKL